MGKANRKCNGHKPDSYFTNNRMKSLHHFIKQNTVASNFIFPLEAQTAAASKHRKLTLSGTPTAFCLFWSGGKLTLLSAMVLLMFLFCSLPRKIIWKCTNIHMQWCLFTPTYLVELHYVGLQNIKWNHSDLERRRTMFIIHSPPKHVCQTLYEAHHVCPSFSILLLVCFWDAVISFYCITNYNNNNNMGWLI